MTRYLVALLLASAAVGDVCAQNPGIISFGGDAGKMSRDTCARKAVAALAAEKFAFAEVTAEGNVRGWSDQTAVLVLSFSSPDPEMITVAIFCASDDKAEGERLRVAVQNHILTGKDDPKSPKKIGPANGSAATAPFAFCWKTEERTAAPVLKHFAAASTIVLEKQGMTSATASPMAVLGAGPRVMVGSFLAPATTGVAVKLNLVTITRGEQPAEKSAEDLLTRVVKILYD